MNTSPRGGALRAGILLTLLLLAAVWRVEAQGLPVITVGTVSGEPSDSVSPEVRILNPGAAVGVQFDLEFEAGLLVSGSPVLVGDWPDLMLVSGVPMPGFLRVAVYSGTGLALPDGLTVALGFRIASRVPPGPQAIEVLEVVFADPQGSRMPGGLSTGGAVTIRPSGIRIPEFTASGRDAAGHFRVTILSDAGVLLTVEGSDDLVVWEVVASLDAAAGGATPFVDSGTVSSGARFYRVRAAAR